MVEALTALLFVLSHRAWPEHVPTAAALSLLMAALVAISYIDLDHRRIPDVITKPGMVIGFLAAPGLALHDPAWIPDLNPGMNAWFHAGAGLLVGYGLILGIRLLGRLVFRKEAMGLGDAKLLALIGVFAGPRGAVYALILACLAGAVIGIVLFSVGKRRPLRCRGSLEAGGSVVEVTGVRVRDGDLLVALPAGVAEGAAVRARLLLPAAKVLEDRDAEVRLAGTVVATLGGPRGTPARVRLEPLGPEDSERLEIFASSYRYVPFGPFLSLGGAAALLFASDLHWLITVGYPRSVQDLFG
jgi:prepilin signal peptidase PulO-like enzyme (type II secretory pathway)